MRTIWIPLFALALAQAVLLSPASAEGEDHVFDPLLSLTGGTSISSLDPVPDPAPHPPQPFRIPCGVAVDLEGNLYVASLGEDVEGQVKNGRIDVFNAAGEFLVEIPNDDEPCDLAVDAAGNLYVSEQAVEVGGIVRYTPSAYPLTSGVTYGAPVLVHSEHDYGIAIDWDTGHLFAVNTSLPHHVTEYSSAEEGNVVIRSDIGAGQLEAPTGIAVDSSTGRIFVSSMCQDCEQHPPPGDNYLGEVKIFAADGTLEETLDGTDIAEVEAFRSVGGDLYLAVDEATGELFVTDTFFSDARVYRFERTDGGTYAYSPDPELEDHGYAWPSRIAVSNGDAAANKGTVFVTSSASVGHLYAFPRGGSAGPPQISNLNFFAPGSDDARLEATINPNGAITTYWFEYVDESTYLEDVQSLGSGHGWDRALSGGQGVLAAGNQALSVSELLSGLAPGVTYRFRVVAENHCGLGEAGVCTVTSEEGRFSTYPVGPLQGPCSNDGWRPRRLPDCRAYELVTPPDTSGHIPTAKGVAFAEGSFATELTTADGSDLLFMTPGGSVGQLGGNGVADGYRAVRTSSGWIARLAGPLGYESQSPSAGSVSPDHGYWFWSTGSGTDHGSLVIGGKKTNYVRFPDRSFHLIGEGPAGVDPQAQGRWIAPGAAHMVFTSTKPLVEGASPQGVLGIYDRTSDGGTHLVSVKPGGGAFSAAATVGYLATSADGSVVVFTATEGGIETLYARRSGSPSVAVATGGAQLAGISSNGDRITYLKEGDLFSYDLSAGASVPVGSGGASVPANVSADGTHVYFVSTKILNGLLGPKSGRQNFYLWSSASEELSFIGILTVSDVTGIVAQGTTVLGLGQWADAVGPSQERVFDPSRSTPDGRAIVFESKAQLTGYDSGGHSEIYRYARGQDPPLSCLSCNPTLAEATADAHLQMLPQLDYFALLDMRTPVRNITDDGRRVFFQSGEALVAEDVDGLEDVYEWEAQGEGGCSRPAGCLSLISSGHSSNPDYIYAVTPDGSDVFFGSSDLLVEADGDTVLSLYDARVGGGFPREREAPCLGDSCRAAPAPAAGLPAPATEAGFGAAVAHRRPCGKKKRAVRRHGKVRCVKKRGSGARESRHRHSGGGGGRR